MRSLRPLSVLLAAVIALGTLAGTAGAEPITLMITGADAKQPVIEATLVPWLAQRGFEAQKPASNDPVFAALEGCSVLFDEVCNRVVKASTLFVIVNLDRNTQLAQDEVKLTGWLYGSDGTFLLSTTQQCAPCTNDLLGQRAEEMAKGLFAERDKGKTPLEVTSSPSGARVLVDGQDRGVTPLSLVEDSGPHTITLELAGRRTETRRVELKKDEPQTVAVTLAADGTGPRRRNPLFLGVAGVGVAAIIGGVVLIAIDEDADGLPSTQETYFDSAPAGVAIAGAGVVAAAVGTFLYLSSGSGGKAPSRTPTAWLAPGHGGGVGLAGTF